MKEIDLTKTGYYDYLIQDGAVKDPGVIGKVDEAPVEVKPNPLTGQTDNFINEFNPKLTVQSEKPLNRKNVVYVMGWGVNNNTGSNKASNGSGW